MKIIDLRDLEKVMVKSEYYEAKQFPIMTIS